MCGDHILYHQRTIAGGAPVLSQKSMLDDGLFASLPQFFSSPLLPVMILMKRFG
jgi:hypothetical protein